jgi:putative ABC transport system permease protein
VVVNVDLLELEPDLTLGDKITIRTGERRTTWQIVGVATSQVIGGGELLKAPIAYANYAPMAQVLGQVGLVNRLLVETQDTASQGQVMKYLETTFNSANTRVSFSLLNVDLQTALENAFSIILNLIQVMSLLFAAVGGLGLMSMMSLNVMERTREIGVIRVIGGVRKVVFQIVVVESLFVGLLNWLAGALLAYPLSKLLSHTLGVTMLRTPLIHVFPLSGLLIWLAAILILASIASIIPARNAARLSVRETLAYE